MPAQHSAALDHPHYGSATELMKKLYLGYKRQAPFITLTCQLTPDVRKKKKTFASIWMLKQVPEKVH